MSVLDRVRSEHHEALEIDCRIPLAVAMSAFGAIAPVGLGASLSAGASASAFCDPAVAGSSSGIQARGGAVREPTLNEVHTDLPASAKGKAGKNFKATVPVYFHVVTDGSTGALTDAQIAGQIAVLNNTFSAGEGGAATGFSFRLAAVTRTDNASWFYANPGGERENSMKRALRQGGTNALNLYSTTAGDYLGWAYLPDIVTKPGQLHKDGVVFSWETVPGASTTFAGRYDQGETATHEVGHWLNLEHTFFGGCNAKGDFVG